ncbi:VC0807 family protein [Actinocrispum wychmicini]|uniref:Intracellular septation protein A n=1 Tax=Actinocrispum wychmicini TaxID=1213861 RepID=A0A4R2JNL3_9PSEU|nr:VC0807 family protein [Actinocrispum wychmicini]TCO58726.1 hypothetical protein EV192_105798 [Actinocrispum wychmicini]
MKKLLPSIVLNAVVPFLIYVLLRPHVDTDLVALAVASSFSAVYTIVMFVWRRRIDPVGAVAVVAYVVVLAISLLSGGNEFVLKVNDTLITGPVGVAFLVSVLAGKPLHLVIHQVVAKRRGLEVKPAVRRGSAVASLLIGATLTVHATVVILMALSLPTGEFLAVQRPVGLSIIGVGVAAIMWHRRRVSLLARRS